MHTIDINNIRNKILEGVNSFIDDNFFENPYNYLFESDIQSHLFAILREQLTGEAEIVVPNNSKSFSGRTSFALNLIYTEYSNSKIDICCLDPSKPTTMNQYDSIRKGDKDPLWDQPLLYGIEVKFITPGYEAKYSQFIADIQKMRKYQERKSTDNTTRYAPNFQYLVLNFVLAPKPKYREAITALAFTKKCSNITEHNCAYVILSSDDMQYLGRYVNSDSSS